MATQTDFIKSYISRKSDNAYTGAVKIGIEHGMIVSVGESNAYDAVVYSTDNLDPFKLEEYTKPFFKPSFNGTFILRFSAGHVDGCAYSRTYKSEDLKRLITAYI